MYLCGSILWMNRPRFDEKNKLTKNSKVLTKHIKIIIMKTRREKDYSERDR